jgi:RNA polymerase sigma-70 factor, ECF subfamily
VFTVTNTSLLIGLRDRNNEVVWKQFFGRYQPVLVSFARKLGLGESDALAAAQAALAGFVTTYREGGYERDKGRLRTWLFAIATQKIRELHPRSREQVSTGTDAGGAACDEGTNAAGGGTKGSALGDGHAGGTAAGDGENGAAVWDAEWQELLVRQCVDEVRRQVKPKTMQAFERFVIQGQPAEKVAAELEMTENAVWIAQNRVATRMREIQKELEENF